jgi:hypothetical protein
MSNPFNKSLDGFRGRRVRVSRGDDIREGYVERIHHHDRHVVLRDAVDPLTGEDLGRAFVAHVDTMEVLDEDSRIETVALDVIEPSPYHGREFDAAANSDYIARVQARGWVGSYPVVRERDGGTLECVAGHKRLWVAKQAGLQEHPVEIIDIDGWTAALRYVVDHVPELDDERVQDVVGTLREHWGERVQELPLVDEAVATDADAGDGGHTEEGDDESEPEPPADDSAEQFKCQDCDYAGDSEHALNIHLSKAHGNDQNDEPEQIWCAICGAGPFETTTELAGHHTGAGHEGETNPVSDPPSDDGDDDSDVDDDGGWYECDECGSSFQNRTKLSNHLKGTVCGVELPDDMSVDEIREFVGECDTLLEVQRELRINRTQARRLLKDHGLLADLEKRSEQVQQDAAEELDETDPDSSDTLSRDELVAGLEDADTVAELADDLGVQASTVLYHLGKHDLEDRIQDMTHTEEVSA